MKKIKRYATAFILLSALVFAGNLKAKTTTPMSTSSDPGIVPVGSQSSVTPAQYGATSIAPATASDKFASATTSTSYAAGGNGNGNGGVGNGNGNGNGNHYPINNAVLFLLAAGIVIGVRGITDQIKKGKIQEA